MDLIFGGNDDDVVVVAEVVVMVRLSVLLDRSLAILRRFSACGCRSCPMAVEDDDDDVVVVVVVEVGGTDDAEEVNISSFGTYNETRRPFFQGDESLTSSAV